MELVKRKHLIDKHCSLSLRRQCALLRVSRGSLYVKPRGESKENLKIMTIIDRHHVERPTKGVKQMQDYLKDLGHKVNVKRVRRLMRKMGTHVVYPKPNLSKLGKAKYIKPYLLRHMDISRPNQVWAIDISYIPMKQGFMYLTVVIDWYSRMVIGWQLSNTLEAQTQVELMDELILKYGKPQIINSDQGSQYTCEGWVAYHKYHGIEVSMDGRGRATDNAIVERFFRTIKQECIYLHPTCNVVELQSQIKEYMAYYNNQRSHQGIERKKPYSLYQTNKKNTTNFNQLVV